MERTIIIVILITVLLSAFGTPNEGIANDGTTEGVGVCPELYFTGATVG